MNGREQHVLPRYIGDIREAWLIASAPFVLVVLEFAVFMLQKEPAAVTLLLGVISTFVLGLLIMVRALGYSRALFKSVPVTLHRISNEHIYRYISILLTSIASISSFAICYELYDRYGVPFTFLEGGERLRLEGPVNKYLNVIQATYLLAFPMVIMLRQRLWAWILVLALCVFVVFTGSRGPILYVGYVTFLFVGLRVRCLLIFLGTALIVSKSFVLGIDPYEYAVAALSSQVEYLNRYVVESHDPYFSYFTFVRPFVTLFGSDPLSLIDLQHTVLGESFGGLLVATGYVYAYLDVGPFCVLAPVVSLLAGVIAVNSARRFPVASIIVSFGLTMMFYDMLFNQLYFILILLASAILDVVFQYHFVAQRNPIR